MNDHRKGSEMDNAEGELSVIKSPGVNERAGGGGALPAADSVWIFHLFK